MCYSLSTTKNHTERKTIRYEYYNTNEELKLIADMRKRNTNAGLVVFWVKLRQRGYSRSIAGLYRILKKQGQMAIKPPNPKYISKPYEKMLYPGQQVQIDVKVVPTACIVGDAQGEKFYQYTAIDEYSRFRYLEAFKEQSTYSSSVYVEHLLKKFPFKIECVQTDIGICALYKNYRVFDGEKPKNLLYARLN